MTAHRDWSFLQTFAVPPRANASARWTELEIWIATAERGARQRIQQLPALLERWDRRLGWLGGDPSGRDWSRFRPLRLTREEDWSDWLAELLGSSRTGLLAFYLFAQSGDSAADYAQPRVEREVPVLEGRRRVDIVLTWHSSARCHIEVKIWDQQFPKTFEAARGLRETSSCSWSDFILLPEESLEQWEAVADARDKADPDIKAIKWRKVAYAIRRVLWSEEEDQLWRAWASAFAGAIESRLLGVNRRCFLGPSLSLSHLTTAVRWIELLEQACDESRAT